MENIRDFEDLVKKSYNEKTIDLFVSNLSLRPYCTDELGSLLIRPKKEALKKRYLQPNQPYSVATLVFDIDSPDGYFLHEDIGAPPPNMIVFNPENGHCHYDYLLSNKLYLYNNPNRKQLDFFHYIKKSYTDGLGADNAYSGLISKNPTHDSWLTLFLHEAPYSLYELYEHMPFRFKPKRLPPKEVIIDGRNTYLYKQIKVDVYRVYRGSNFTMKSDDLYTHALDITKSYNVNMDAEPLANTEIKHIAKNCVKFTVRKHSLEGFKEWCSERGKASGVARQKKAFELYRELHIFYTNNPTVSNRQIAKLFKVAEGTVRNAKKFFAEKAKDDNLIINLNKE